ncbi:TPA: TrkH family potassium uptake protein, partial [Staphylococcus aureus]|nr:TrkH family potassium uptake protein [Staphylococcus aureus]
IGFPVLLEVKAYIQNRVTNFRFSLFTKITTSTYLFLFIVGVLAILLFEHNHAFKGLSWHQSLFYSLFQSATTRSAGLQTIDVTTLSDPTNIIMGILMFIGSSPSSVGGGIRTTTFAILILFLINFSNNADKTSIKVYNREVHIMDIQRSFAVFTMATILTFLGMLIISATENGKLTFLQVFFEVMSAFGTCGLSLGVTSDISDISKVVLMILMFIGRVGLISFIIMIAGRREPDKFHYPKERIQIG